MLIHVLHGCLSWGDTGYYLVHPQSVLHVHFNFININVKILLFLGGYNAVSKPVPIYINDRKSN